MRGWFRSLGVGTKRNNRPLPKRLLLALSGPRLQHGGMSAIWVNADLFTPTSIPATFLRVTVSLN